MVEATALAMKVRSEIAENARLRDQGISISIIGLQ
jgi:hypothetical protein